MPNKINSQNLDAHYSKDTKVKPLKHFTAVGPQYVESQYVYSDTKANQRIQELNQDVYDKVQEKKKKDGRNFALASSIIAASILAIIGIAKIFKKS